MDVPTPTGAILALIKACFKHNDHLAPLVKSYMYLFRKDIRISMACLVRYEFEGKIILVRNRHRQEYIAPFGGVIKFHEDARTVLDNIEFQSEQKSSTDKDLIYDLRGYLKSRHFGTFMTWFKSRTGREQVDALHRELREEFAESGIPQHIATPLIEAKYSLVRVIHEGPYGHDEHKHATFRYLEIYKPVMSQGVEEALKHLAEISTSSDSKTQLVNKQELDKLRTRLGVPIAGHARYLNSAKWHGFEPAAL
ncbi:SMODS-associated NUDIX domain-containing protein [Pseudomonas frederiksbergensis]|uniref:CD-NTase-associated protein 16 NUDIX domain-containing protein n=1 Tax=Pseudomonas frederiksbergensis TaxID=104087 RepID=A0A423KSQ8_9PSED|nr:hypothetical protein [Pseudomonas frederiksbergensis]RON58734.1 hypothetical protein BK665_02025 [Pseudomonas frederiksbergensis]